MKRFHQLKFLFSSLRKWIEKEFKHSNLVAAALYDLHSSYLASYGNYKISSQELSLLCGERYLSDDGYHCPVPEKLKQNARRIFDAIFQTSGDVKFNPSAWCDIRRFIVPLLDQPSSVTGSPEGCGSCGMAIVFVIRDVCNENTEPFS